MADHDHDYVHGTMDIHEQQSTFALFWAITKWSSILIIITLVLLAVTRTNAADCKKSDQAAAHLNSCGKLHVEEPAAEGAEH